MKFRFFNFQSILAAILAYMSPIAKSLMILSLKNLFIKYAPYII